MDIIIILTPDFFISIILNLGKIQILRFMLKFGTPAKHTNIIQKGCKDKPHHCTQNNVSKCAIFREVVKRTILKHPFLDPCKKNLFGNTVP